MFLIVFKVVLRCEISNNRAKKPSPDEQPSRARRSPTAGYEPAIEQRNDESQQPASLEFAEGFAVKRLGKVVKALAAIVRGKDHLAVLKQQSISLLVVDA